MLGYLSDFDNDFFGEFENMRRMMDNIFGARPGLSGIRSVAAGSFPAINIGASPERVDVYVYGAGVDPNSLNISMPQNLLTVAGERKVELPEKVKLYRNERFAGGFHRLLTLPEDVDPDKVSVTCRKGVLQITVERREALRSRRIEVQ
jgi:HSP20 family protein